jgi:hypothetical protein
MEMNVLFSDWKEKVSKVPPVAGAVGMGIGATMFVLGWVPWVKALGLLVFFISFSCWIFATPAIRVFVRRGPARSIEAKAAAGELVPGEVGLETDTKRVLIATSPSTYVYVFSANRGKVAKSQDLIETASEYFEARRETQDELLQTQLTQEEALSIKQALAEIAIRTGGGLELPARELIKAFQVVNAHSETAQADVKQE